MQEEVKLGASYIVRLLNRHQKLDSEQVERFTETLTNLLCDKFEGHWYPDTPQKGQAYRCIRIEQSHPVDDTVLQACIQSGLRCSQLALPRDMSLWIDPKEVSCRLGESCRPFIVKNPEDQKIPKSQSPDKLDLETSDYHSDTSVTPSESSSEDEEQGGKKKTTSASQVVPKKMGTQFYYSPTPASPVYYQYPRNTLSLIPAFQPVTLYYYIPKPPKVYPSVKSKGYQQKWKPTRTPLQSTA